MLYAAIDIRKHAFHAAVFDPETGEVVEQLVNGLKCRVIESP